MRDDSRIKTSEPVTSTWLHSKGCRLGIPVAGNFEITPRCNFSCPMCYIHLDEEQIARRGCERDAAWWLELAEAACRQGMVFLMITGGEPLAYPEFKKLFHGLKRMGLMISINSNGYLLDEDMIEFFRKDPPFRLNVTLYAGSNEGYEKMCGVPAFDRIKSNLKKVKDAGIDVRLNVSVTPYNAQELEKIYETADELELHVKASAYMYPQTRIDGSCDNRFSPEEAAEYTLKCFEQRMSCEELKLYANGMLRQNDDDCLGAAEGSPVKCRAGRSAFWITWDGRMLPCGMLPHTGACIDEAGFDRAWEETREFTAGIRLPAECEVCSYADRCYICAAASYTETGAFDKKPEYLCRMSESLYRLAQDKYAIKEDKNTDEDK